MKKVLSLALSLALIIISISIPFMSSAETIEKQIGSSYNVQYLPDGSYIETYIVEKPAVNNRIASLQSTSTKSGEKYGTYRNSDGQAMFTFTVYGTFSVNYGNSSTCIDSSYSTAINDSSWSVKSASSYCSGNSSIGNSVFVRKFLFVVVDTQPLDLTLSCDAYGNFY